MYREHFGLRQGLLGKDSAELWDDGALAQVRERFQWLLRSPGLGLITGYEKEPVMERKQRMRLIYRTSTPVDLLIITRGFHIESSHVRSCGSRFQRGGFPGLAVASTFSRALRLVSRLARA